jgi:2-amino-4-hydroxy-6-hydroxymethyldihydropteridine diphosphokinase
MQKAVEIIDSDVYCRVTARSNIYETEPFGFEDQNNFLNAVIAVETEYGPKQLFRFLKEIENKLGRTESRKWGPREIDLDLLFYNKSIYSDFELKIPHRGILVRDFVIVPFCDIAPDFVHPETEKAISQIDLNKIEKNIITKTDYKL